MPTRRNFLKLLAGALLFPKDCLEKIAEVAPAGLKAGDTFTIAGIEGKFVASDLVSPHPGWSELTMSVDDYARLYMEPAARKLAEQIDLDIMRIYQNEMSDLQVRQNQDHRHQEI